MIGPLIALIMFGIDFVNHVANEKALYDASTWLYSWSVGWAIFVAFVLFVGVFINVTNQNAATRASYSPGAILLAVLAGAGCRTFNFGFLIVCAINTALLVGGAYLLQSSVNASAILDDRRLVVGGILIGITMVMRMLSFLKLRTAF